MASHTVPTRYVYNVLWTGGWDSTFRVLQVLTENPDAVVQPHYLVDPCRSTTGIEMKTIHRITQACDQTTIYSRRIRPLVKVSVNDLLADKEIEQSWQAIRNHHPIGVQYKWLAQYAKHAAINDLEIGIQKGGHIDSLIGENMVRKPAPSSHTYVINEGTARGPYYLFSFFEFPIIRKSKRDMINYAQARGFAEIMDMTWFCFWPLGGIHPCGFCNPCNSAFRQGMKHRIGWRGLLLGVPAGLVYRKLPTRLQHSLRRIARLTQSSPRPTP